MGNEWELMDEREKLIQECPCRAGGVIHVDRTYLDDYGRYHYTDDEYINCEKCKKDYKFFHSKWIKIDDYNEYTKLDSENNKYNVDLYMILYTKYYKLVLDIIKSKKALYEVLYSHRLFNVPGTLQTFYKNGIEYYISNHRGYGYQIYDFITLLEVTSCILDKDDKEEIELSKKRKNELELFLYRHSL